MKLHVNPPKCQASVMIIAMVFAGIVGLVLLSYLELLHARATVRARSQAWNSAIPVLEAGIEEAFAHLQRDSNNLTANNWVSPASGICTKSRTNSDGSYFVVTISNSLTTTIFSQGFVPVPLSSGYISRSVRVETQISKVFTKAIAARGTVTVGGSNPIIDSFDSSSTNGSTGGAYDPAKRRANAGVVAGSSADPAVKLAGGAIYGHVETAPGGTVTIGTGTIGDTNWNSGIEPGWTNNTFNFAFANADPPPGCAGWFTPISGSYSVGGTNYDYSLSGQYYSPGDLKLSSSRNIIVTGPTELYVNGDIGLSASAYIYIAPGASLKLYGGGKTTSLAGGGVCNGTGFATNFSYIGMTNNTDVGYSGKASLVGTIYAPQANFSISGGASFFGAAVVDSFQMNGGGNIHYDEAVGVPGNPVLASYREF